MKKKKDKIVKACGNCIHYNSSKDRCNNPGIINILFNCDGEYQHWSPKPCGCKKPDCLLCEEHEKIKILLHAKFNMEIREALTPILEHHAHEYALSQGFTGKSMDDMRYYKWLKKAYIAGAMLLMRHINL